MNFKTAKLKSNLWDCSDSYILGNGNVIIAEVGTDATGRKTDKKIKH